MKTAARNSLLTACIVGLGFALSSCSPTTFEEKVDWGKVAVSSHLDLTDEQEPALDDIADTIKVNYPDFKNIRSDFQSILKEELQQKNFNVSRVNSKVDELEGRVLDVGDELIEEFAALHKTLTPEQRETIKNHTHDKDRKHRRWKHRDGHKHHFKDFDLQPHQAEAMKKLVSGIAVDSVDLMMAKNQLKKTIKAELAAEEFNGANVRKEFENIVNILSQGVDRHLPVYAELHALFDERQRNQLVAAVDHWIERSQEND